MGVLCAHVPREVILAVEALYMSLAVDNWAINSLFGVVIVTLLMTLEVFGVMPVCAACLTDMTPWSVGAFMMTGMKC